MTTSGSRVPGGAATAEIGGGDGGLGPRDSVLYFSLSLRNVGNGDRRAARVAGKSSNQAPHTNEPRPPLDEFVMQTRDMYIPVGDIGFWQGAIRDLADPRYPAARKTVENRNEWMVDLLYGDQDGGQRAISRFRCQPRPWQARPRDDGSPPGPGASGPGARPGAVTTATVTTTCGWPRWRGAGPSTNPTRARPTGRSSAAGRRGLMATAAALLAVISWRWWRRCQRGPEV